MPIARATTYLPRASRPPRPGDARRGDRRRARPARGWRAGRRASRSAPPARSSTARPSRRWRSARSGSRPAGLGDHVVERGDRTAQAGERGRDGRVGVDDGAHLRATPVDVAMQAPFAGGEQAARPAVERDLHHVGRAQVVAGDPGRRHQESAPARGRRRSPRCRRRGGARPASEPSASARRGDVSSGSRGATSPPASGRAPPALRASPGRRPAR